MLSDYFHMGCLHSSQSITPSSALPICKQCKLIPVIQDQPWCAKCNPPTSPHASAFINMYPGTRPHILQRMHREHSRSEACKRIPITPTDKVAIGSGAPADCGGNVTSVTSDMSSSAVSVTLTVNVSTTTTNNITVSSPPQPINNQSLHKQLHRRNGSHSLSKKQQETAGTVASSLLRQTLITQARTAVVGSTDS
jgi:hypothetical protein